MQKDRYKSFKYTQKDRCIGKIYKFIRQKKVKI